LNESPIKRYGKFDILNWWSANPATYPTLAAISLDVLAIPVPTVASESARIAFESMYVRLKYVCM
jgi:hypothetical protein